MWKFQEIDIIGKASSLWDEVTNKACFTDEKIHESSKDIRKHLREDLNRLTKERNAKIEELKGLETDTYLSESEKIDKYFNPKIERIIKKMESEDNNKQTRVDKLVEKSVGFGVFMLGSTATLGLGYAGYKKFKYKPIEHDSTENIICNTDYEEIPE